ncbi:unnamed protein product, partial [Tuber aestivum]
MPELYLTGVPGKNSPAGQHLGSRRLVLSTKPLVSLGTGARRIADLAVAPRLSALLAIPLNQICFLSLLGIDMLLTFRLISGTAPPPKPAFARPAQRREISRRRSLTLPSTS